MKRIGLQRYTFEDQRKLNTDEQSLYSSGTGELYQDKILLKEWHFDPKGIKLY